MNSLKISYGLWATDILTSDVEFDLRSKVTEAKSSLLSVRISIHNYVAIYIFNGFSAISYVLYVGNQFNA